MASTSPEIPPNLLKSVSDMSHRRSGFNPSAQELGPKRQDSGVRLLRADSELLQAQAVIVVLGPTGAGKSKFIRDATGQDVEVGDALESVTKEIRPYHLKLNSQHIALVDTPGFDDTYRPDAEIFKDLAIWLAARYQTQSQVTAILYMQPINATRMAGSALRNLTTMKKMLGVESFPHLTLVSTMWDIVDPGRAVRRHRDLIKNYWQDLIDQGATVERSFGDRASALRILETIQVDGKSIALTIQQEIVDEELPLERTSAGTFLGHEFRRLANAENQKLQKHQSVPDQSSKKRDEEPVISATSIEEKRLFPGLVNEEQQTLAELQKNLKELRVLNNANIADSGSLWLSDDAAEIQGLVNRPFGRGYASRTKYEPEDYQSLFLAPEASMPLDTQQTIYERLRDDEFRLVHLRAGQGKMPVELSLIVASLLHPPQYAALSYVVGENNPCVSVNFRRSYHVFPIDISDNLETALRFLRRPYKDIFLWVDALSINQFNLQERSREVRRMSQIFRKASNVCIWLGSVSHSVQIALDFIPEVLDFSRLEETVQDTQKRGQWIELVKLMSRAYFRRRWVVQEILLARNATVHCNDRVVPWQDFVDAAVLLRSKWPELQQNLELTDEENLGLGDAQLLGAASLIEVSRLVFRKDRHGNILQRLLSLEMLLSLLPTFEVTELLDTVYAIIDLAKDDGGAQRIRIDYSLEPEELFQDVTKLVIESSNSLDIICRPWAPKCGVPSWIPTLARYTFRRRACNFQYDRQQGVSLVGKPHARPYRACGETTPENCISFRLEGIQRILSACGFVLGTIEEIGQRSMNGNIPKEWMEIGGWLDMKNPVPESFWRTLVADRCSEGSAVPEWYGRACQFAFRQSTRDDIDTTILMKTIKSTHVHEFLDRVQEVTWGRTLAAIGPVIPSELSLCPPDAKTGDIVVILYGCSVPVVLRKVRSYYKLIGECFVYERMDGESFARRDANSPTETFDLI